MTKSTLRSILLAAAAAAALCAAPAHGAVLFSDDFETDAAGSVLNFNGFIRWSVDGHPTETVDYIRTGGFGITCFGGSSGCVDLDGSTGNPGRLVSSTLFTFLPGVNYTLSVQLSGNQRGGASDAFEMGILGVTALSIGGIAPSDPFTAWTLGFTVASLTTGRIFVRDANPGGDNIGPILDNVLLVDSLNGGGKVAEPSALALLGLGLAGLLAGLRRKTTSS
jgi:hypothetical protein